MKDFVEQLILSLNITQNSRIGVITYNSAPQVTIPLDTVQNATELVNQVDSIVFTGGSTGTDLALNLLLGILNITDRPRVGILLTDGRSNNPSATIVAAQSVRDAGITMYAFGISGANDAELVAIANTPTFDHRFFIGSFNASQFNTILLPLAVQTCTTPQQVPMDVPTNHSVTAGQSVFIELTFDPTMGLTLQLSITTGAVTVYISFAVRNPGVSTADLTFQVQNADAFAFFLSPEQFAQLTGFTLPSGSSRRRRQSPGSVQVFVNIQGSSPSNSFVVQSTPGNMVSPVETSLIQVSAAGACGSPVVSWTSLADNAGLPVVGFEIFHQSFLANGLQVSSGTVTNVSSSATSATVPNLPQAAYHVFQVQAITQPAGNAVLSNSLRLNCIGSSTTQPPVTTAPTSAAAAATTGSLCMGVLTAAGVVFSLYGRLI